MKRPLESIREKKNLSVNFSTNFQDFSFAESGDGDEAHKPARVYVSGGSSITFKLLN